MKREMFFSIGRHALTAGAGYLASHGVIDHSATKEVVGAAGFLLTIFFSWVNKRTHFLDDSTPAPNPK